MYATQINKCARRRRARGDHEYVFAESAPNKRHKGRPNLLSTQPPPLPRCENPDSLNNRASLRQ